MKDIELLPANFAKLELERKAGPPEADLITIMNTPYPVLTNYKKLCREMGISPYAGGGYLQQGSPNAIGYITSGYRDSLGAENSAHKFGFAIDVAVGDIDEQIRWIKKAIEIGLFTRAGFYPDEGIIHLDLASRAWMEKYGGRRFWVCVKESGTKKYTSFDQLEEAIEFAKGV